MLTLYNLQEHKTQIHINTQTHRHRQNKLCMWKPIKQARVTFTTWHRKPETQQAFVSWHKHTRSPVWDFRHQAVPLPADLIQTPAAKSDRCIACFICVSEEVVVKQKQNSLTAACFCTVSDNCIFHAFSSALMCQQTYQLLIHMCHTNRNAVLTCHLSQQLLPRWQSWQRCPVSPGRRQHPPPFQ